MPTVFWDARQLLDCYPLVGKFKYTGTTAKGARCRQTFIDRKSESDQTLSVLSSKDVVSHGLHEDMKVRLQSLAELTLCPRWHRRSQANAVYLKWTRIIHEFTVEERARVEIQREQIQRPIRAPRPIQPGPAVPVRLQVPPDPAAQREDLDEIQRLIDLLDRRINLRDAARTPDIDRVLHLPAGLPARQRAIPHPPAQQNPPVVGENNAPCPRERPLRPEIIADRAVNAQAAQPQQAALPVPRPAIQQAPARVQPHVHRRPRVAVERKPLGEDCYVCYEPFDSPDNAVWCRRRCGQNIHKECFEQWCQGKVLRDIICGY
ncbi:hypothetical protein N431DRAFT_491910 [Stipitochalara longipes BDJ]|nr:hypothetical protein N431DRAFT_491910 [Stipitochalara longipes BDJ]